MVKSNGAPAKVAPSTVHSVTVGDELQNGSRPAASGPPLVDCPCGITNVRVLENITPRHGLTTSRRRLTVILSGAGVNAKTGLTTSTLNGPSDRFLLPKGFKRTAIGALNVALQVLLPVTLTVVVRVVPEQSTPQPPKVEPKSGVAMSCTAPFSGATHVGPQLIPVGTEVTVPVPPVPFFVTVSIPPAEKVAMQALLELVMLIVVVGFVPEQSPPQLVKLDPDAAEAVS